MTISPTCWIITDGNAGNENQCLGLAAELGLTPVIKRVKLRFPWRQLSPFLRRGLRWAWASSSDVLTPPWPDILIASGRVGAVASLYVRRASKRHTFTVQIQNPVISAEHFDLVAVPRHDGLIGDNVISTRGSLHRLTPDLLQREATKFRYIADGLPRPLITVLIGGSNAVYDFAPDEAYSLGALLREAAEAIGGGILLTVSRRTPVATQVALQESVRGLPAFIWDGSGENPCYGIVGLADYLVVTADSVNMVSEMCSTGKPVYVFPLRGGSEKFRRFHQTLHDDGLTRPFEGRVENWDYQPLDDVHLVADKVRTAMR